MKNEVTLVLERELFTAKDGREMYGYFVRGEVYGKERKADFTAKDQGGYEVLDVMFTVKPTVDLVVWEEVMKDDRGNETPYMVYEARMIDEDGVVFAYRLKLARESDKTFLNVFIQKQAK